MPKSKNKQNLFPCYLMIIIAISAFAILFGAAVVVWYSTAVSQPLSKIAANQMVLQQKINKIKGNDFLKEWRSYKNEEYGLAFKYPENVFHRAPNVMMIDCEQNNFPKQCPDIDEAVIGSVSQNYWRNSDGEKIMIDDTQYCVYRHSEGAAGTEYVDYYYTTVKDSQCLVIHFTLSFANCYNFGAPGDKAYEDCLTENKTKINTLNDVIYTFEIEN